MLVELAVGDAYGFGFEFAPPEFVTQNNQLGAYVQHPTRPHIKPGQYSDDTQMSIAMAEMILSGKTVTPLHLADTFVEVFQRDPRQGYAGGFYNLLLDSENGEDFLWKIQPHSNKGGGAMRAAPFGFLANPELVRDRAMWQASLTHATKEGMESAAVAALLVHFCRRGVPISNLNAVMHDYVPGILGNELWDGPVGNRGYEVVKAAWSAIVNGMGSLTGILREAVAYTGDVDTVAAIAMAAAAVHPEVTHNLPEWLFTQLENGPYGYDFLVGLDGELERVLPSPGPYPYKEPELSDCLEGTGIPMVEGDDDLPLL